MDNTRKNSTVFTVATFNLRKDTLIDLHNRWKYRKQLAAEAIRGSGASIIGVQELLPAMRSDIKVMLDGYSIYGWGRNRKTFSEHSDLIIRDGEVDVSYSKTFWLSKTPEKKGSRAYYAMFPRICTVAEAYLRPLGRKIRVFNTHFDHICGPAKRLGVRIILDYIKLLDQKEPMPVILMGDLNSKPDDPAVKMIIENKICPLRNALDEYNTEKQIEDEDVTYHWFSGMGKSRQIDYIFVSDEFVINKAFIQRDKYNGKYPSDHYPVIASLSFAE